MKKLFFIVFLSVTAAAQQTNIAVLQSLLDTVLYRAGAMQKNGAISSAIQLEAGNATSFFMQHIAQRTQQEFGLSGAVSIRIDSLGISYLHIASLTDIFAESRYERCIALGAATGGEIIQVSFCDTVTSSQITTLESTLYDFSIGKFKKNESIEQLTLYGGLVIAALVSIYLFFTVRSG